MSALARSRSLLTKHLTTLLLLLLLPVLPRPSVSGTEKEDSVRITVRDDNGQGVPSLIVLLRGTSERTPIDDTDSKGFLMVPHQCALGERFRAEPKDATFFSSDEPRCKKEVTLLVAKRETPDGVVVKRAARRVSVRYKNGTTAKYALVWTARAKTQPHVTCYRFPTRTELH
jgi:hypothetical protein